MNLLCSLEKLGLTNYIVGALDKPMYDLLIAKGHPTFPAFEQSLLGSAADDKTEWAHMHITTVAFSSITAVVVKLNTNSIWR